MLICNLDALIILNPSFDKIKNFAFKQFPFFSKDIDMLPALAARVEILNSLQEILGENS